MFRAEIMGLGLLASTSMIFEQRLEVCGNPGRSIPAKGKNLQWGPHPWVEPKKENEVRVNRGMLPDSSFCPTS